MLRARIGGLALAGFAATALACGAVQQPPAGGGAPGGAAPDQPKAGGSLKTRITSDIDNWDITIADKNIASRYSPLVTNRLLGNKAAKDVGYADVVLTPELAEKWEVSHDARSFTFHLRKGVKWANQPPLNGRELTSDDVKWSFDYQTRTGALQGSKLPRGQFDWMLEGLDSIETPDKYTVVVKFKEAFAPFLNYAGSANMPMLPKEIHAEKGNFQDYLIGTGPFQYDKGASQTGTRFVFKKNPDYFKPGQPYLDEIVELVVRDDATAQAAFQTKQIDIIFAESAQGAQVIERANPQAVKFEGPLPAPMNIYINSRPGSPSNDVRLRKALALGINREEFIQTFSGGKGTPALAGALPDTFSPEEARKMLRHDPVEAKRLVEDAGFKDGVSVDWLHFADDSSDYRSEVQLVQAQLKKVGINLNLKPLERQDAINTRRQGNFQLSGVGKALDPDGESYLYQVFFPKAGNNYGGVDDAKLTAMINAQRREGDPAKRQAIIQEAVRYVNAEQYYGLALYYKTRYEFWTPALKGYFPQFWGRFMPYPVDTVWLDKWQTRFSC
jgi:peptide/nickel transport system substrate-binding protein